MTVVLVATVSTLTIFHNFRAAVVNEMRRIRRNTIGIVRSGLACHARTDVFSVQVYTATTNVVC